ncbi:MAG: hypothetical protein J6A88_01705 [Oscillospiraceae bacterium]|nr:hypothetical protein [Oscillospiraceae bacterium]
MTALKKKQKKNYILPLAAVLCVLSIAVMIFALTRQEVQTEMGEFTPPPFDAAAQVGTPVVPDGLGYSELDCQAYKVSLCGKLDTSGDLWLTNPESNEVWLKVRVLDAKGNILGETGLVRPGEYVQTVELTTIPKSGTPITLKIMAYEPDTYYSAGAASLNTTFA